MTIDGAKITTDHLSRAAWVYVRQSSGDQVQNNLESQRLQYGLVDRARSLGLRKVEVIEDDLRLQRVLSNCRSTALVFASRPDGGSTTAAPRTANAGVDALRMWDDNGNGRITCKEARRHGIAPVPRGHPAYPFMRDGDGDGVVCE